MNKEILLLSLLLIISIIAISECIENNNDSNQTFQTNNDTTLVVGFNVEFPPYGYKADNGSYEGFDLDLAQEVCKRNNWTFKPQPIDWDAKDAELESAYIDCIWNGFTITVDRKNEYCWSNPYFNNKQIFVVKTDSNINKISDLAGKTVETQKDSSTLESLKGDNKTISNKFNVLTEVSDYDIAFMDLESGACDAIAMDIGVAEYNIKKKNSTKFKILDEVITTENYGIGFKKGNDELKNKVQITLDEMFKDGTVEKIAQKYGISTDALIKPE